MMLLSILLHLLVFGACFGGMIWSEYHDNVGERVGMAIIGGTSLVRVALAADFAIAEPTDVLIAGGLVLFAWGKMCAKLRNRRARLARAHAA